LFLFIFVFVCFVFVYFVHAGVALARMVGFPGFSHEPFVLWFDCKDLVFVRMRKAGVFVRMQWIFGSNTIIGFCSNVKSLRFCSNAMDFWFEYKDWFLFECEKFAFLFECNGFLVRIQRLVFVRM
jgi:hypothetical protein